MSDPILDGAKNVLDELPAGSDEHLLYQYDLSVAREGGTADGLQIAARGMLPSGMSREQVASVLEISLEELDD